MFNISHVEELGVKELISIFRDPMLLLLIVYAFTFSVFISVRASPDVLNNTPIGIVDEDASPLFVYIAKAFLPSYFTVCKDINMSQMDALLDNGDITFALDIP